MGTMLGRLHAASGTLPRSLPGREDFALPGREELEEAFAQLETPWDQGPFAEPARELLRARVGGLRDRLRAYDALAGRVSEEPGTCVVTHGEPHSANVIRDAGGGLVLVDWDTTLVAPPERDLWMTLDADLTGWDEYRAVFDDDAVAYARRDLHPHGRVPAAARGDGGHPGLVAGVGRLPGVRRSYAWTGAQVNTSIRMPSGSNAKNA